MENPTFIQRLAQTFGCHPKFPIKYYDQQGKLKDRVAIHDSIHLLIINRHWPVNFRIQDEYSAAIAQAVLRRETRVSYRMHGDGVDTAYRDHPPLEEMRTHVLPNIPRFMEQVLTDWCMPKPAHFPAVDDAFIEHHYRAAMEFDRLFEERYGKPFYQVGAEELMTMEFMPVKELYRQAVLQTAILPASARETRAGRLL